MEIFVMPGAKKLIKKLPKILQIAVVEKLQKMRLSNSVNSIKLSGYKDFYRVRVGNYRIVYKAMDGKIYVVLVGHRREIYKLLDRFMK